MSSVALLVLLYLTSLHACINARLLASNDNQVGIKIHYFAKVVEKAKLSDETPHLKPTSVPLVEHQTQEDAGNKERISHENGDAKNVLKQKIPMFHLSNHQDQPAKDGVTSGNGITKPFSHIELERSIEITQGQNGQARSMLGSTPQDTKEAVAKENDSVDDIEMMDYAQPHRKPPIHNEKP